MARLNEPLASPDDIESLKRRFTRQNKDFARANSTQSQHIRNLENEVSRLLAENLQLREQVLRLQSELENRPVLDSDTRTLHLKLQLETKISEISTLLSHFGSNYKATKKASSTREEQSKATPLHQLGGDLKNNWPHSEDTVDQIERLSPILEDKAYPRRTLEFQEVPISLTEAETSALESPEIGPPPKSQFVDEEPMKIDLPKRNGKLQCPDSLNLDVTLPIAVEHRKKRRDTADVELASEPETTRHCRATGSLKTGAKRKMCSREDDDKMNSSIEQKDESLTTPLMNPLNNREDTENSQTREYCTSGSYSAESTPDLSVAENFSSRKILGPKSVNCSPRKLLTPLKVDSENLLPLGKIQLDLKESNPIILTPGRQGTAAPTSSVEQHEPAKESDTIKTVHLSEHLAPCSTSAKQHAVYVDSSELPPELSSRADSGRPSRRLRASVSYAEPNLRQKMRRPTKSLADAVMNDKASHGSVDVSDASSHLPTGVTPEPPQAQEATSRTTPLNERRSRGRTLSPQVTQDNASPEENSHPESPKSERLDEENLLPRRRRSTMGLRAVSNNENRQRAETGKSTRRATHGLEGTSRKHITL